jgi:hypothetical protein
VHLTAKIVLASAGVAHFLALFGSGRHYSQGHGLQCSNRLLNSFPCKLFPGDITTYYNAISPHHGLST